MRKKNNVLVGFRLDKQLIKKFKVACEEERHNYNDMLEIILEIWLRERESRKTERVIETKDDGGNEDHGTTGGRRRGAA